MLNSFKPEELQATHEEADTLIGYHVSKVLSRGNVIVRASDTDILVILISLLGRHVTEESINKVFMDCGTANHRRLIDVNCICENLKSFSDIPAALPGLHAFTGCDLNSAFYRKGKLKQFEILQKNTEYIQAFKRLSLEQVEPNMTVFSSFVCEMYGQSGTTDVNEARYRLFKKMSGKGQDENPFENVKRIDCSLLPPCENTLKMQVLRAKYVSIVWAKADQRNPTDGLDPLQFGWMKNLSDRFTPDWFTGSSIPSNLLNQEVINEYEELEEYHEDDGWSTDSSSDYDL